MKKGERVRDRADRAEWTKRVEAWKASGRKADDFAHEHGWRPGTLKWWDSEIRRRTRARADESPQTFVPARAVSERPQASVFDGVEIIVGKNLTVRVGHSFDGDALARVLAAASRAV